MGHNYKPVLESLGTATTEAHLRSATSEATAVRSPRSKEESVQPKNELIFKKYQKKYSKFHSDP